MLLAATCAGCRAGAYPATALPEHLQAAPLESTRALDLTRLARPRPNTEQVFAGDLLEIAVTTGLERQMANRWRLRVGDDGMVNIPLVGLVRVEGLLLPQAEQAIRDMSVSRGIYRNPQVAVQLAERRSIRVSVVGEVTRPGDYDLPAVQADLLAAISAAGGLKHATAGEIIEISHPNNGFDVQQASYRGAPPGSPAPRNLTVDLRTITPERGTDFHLENGSVVMVGKKPPRTFSVIGLVKKPGQYDGLNDQDIRLLDAIAMAGGRTMEIADKVRIYRTIDGRDTPIVIEASVRDAKGGGPANVRLAPGDVVSLEETPATFVVGTIKGFARFGLSSSVPLF